MYRWSRKHCVTDAALQELLQLLQDGRYAQSGLAPTTHLLNKAGKVPGTQHSISAGEQLLTTRRHTGQAHYPPVKISSATIQGREVAFAPLLEVLQLHYRTKASIADETFAYPQTGVFVLCCVRLGCKTKWIAKILYVYLRQCTKVVFWAHFGRPFDLLPLFDPTTSHHALGQHPGVHKQHPSAEKWQFLGLRGAACCSCPPSAAKLLGYFLQWIEGIEDGIPLSFGPHLVEAQHLARMSEPATLV